MSRRHVMANRARDLVRRDREIHALADRGVSRSEIARRFGVHKRTVDMALDRDVSTKTARDCITCGDEFQSEGAHNRMCGTCRAMGGATPFDDDLRVAL